MHAIEFSARPRRGIIRIPESCKKYNGQDVRVILLADDEQPSASLKNDLREFSGVLRLREDPLKYQKRIRREWK